MRYTSLRKSVNSRKPVGESREIVKEEKLAEGRARPSGYGYRDDAVLSGMRR